jgi:hypothetical protein
MAAPNISTAFLAPPSFLAHQRALEEGQGRSNCQTLFGMTAIPSDAYIRLMLRWRLAHCIRSGVLPSDRGGKPTRR